MYKLYQILVLVPVVFFSSVWAGSTMAVMCPLAAWLKAHLPFSLGIMTRPDWWGTFASRWWAKMIVRASLLSVEVTGRENIEPGQSYVFTANHQGAYDIFLVSGYLGYEFRWMMKRSLEKIPFLGIGCRHAGYIYVDKDTASGVRNTIRNAEKALKDGASVMVFPEGARTWDGKMGEFHKGAFLVANEFQLPVIPMTINGSFDVLPRQNDGKFIHRHKLSLTIHKPIQPIGKGKKNIEYLMQESYEAIKKGLSQ